MNALSRRDSWELEGDALSASPWPSLTAGHYRLEFEEYLPKTWVGESS